MPKCVIDGKEVEFSAGENMVDVAKRAGIEIPVFCYHPGLTVVAQCRMCAVEVEKMPKLQTACSTPVADGMVIKTKSDKVKSHQKSVMEFLLVNHPLDCPICDKSGECDLQDTSYSYGDSNTRYTEERRTYLDLDMGPVIKKSMNRCIHCTRCIRFGDEIAGIREMVAIHRGNSTEISTIDGKPLETEYAGNYADICPTGSLTLKDFRFKKRVWFLKKTKTICEGCSRGCSVELHQDNNVIVRTIARENKEVNKYWICDEGRFHFNSVHNQHRIVAPVVEGSHSDWATAIHRLKTLSANQTVHVLIGTDLTNEEVSAIKMALPKASKTSVFSHFGTPGLTSAAKDEAADALLKRKSKTSNLHGVEKLGIAGFEKFDQSAGLVLVFSGGRAVLPDVSNLGKAKVIGVGVFTDEEAKTFAAVLPATTFAEKSGTIVNFMGIEQKLQAAIRPVGSSKQISEILMLWQNQQGSEGHSNG